MLTEYDIETEDYVEKEEKKRGKTPEENTFGQIFQIEREITVYLGTFTSRVSSTPECIFLSQMLEM
jgi:hypothetical protein